MADYGQANKDGYISLGSFLLKYFEVKMLQYAMFCCEIAWFETYLAKKAAFVCWIGGYNILKLIN